jgi:hypothetical protein
METILILPMAQQRAGQQKNILGLGLRSDIKKQFRTLDVPVFRAD